MRLWELLRLAVGGIRRTPLRMALTVLGVAIATGLLVALVSFCLGVQQRLEEPFIRLELFNRLNVSPKADAAKSAELRPDSERLKSPPPVLDDAAVARISRLPGVAVAYPELRLGNIQVLQPGAPVETWALGLPRESGRLRYVQEGISAGRYFSPNPGPSEVLVGRQLAGKLGFDPPADAVGQTLSLKVSGLSLTAERTFKPDERAIGVQVVGVWDPVPGLELFPTDLFLLPVDLARELPGGLSAENFDLKASVRPDGPLNYRRVVVRVERPGDLFEVEEQIDAMGYQAKKVLDEIERLREFFILMDLVWGAVGAVALLVAGLGIVNTMLMAVLERYREIGVYKALGASDGDIRLMFLVEAGLVGLLGGSLGLVLGRLVSWLCEKGFNAFARSKGIEEPMAAAFPPQLLLCALALALIVSLISGVYPASRAARVDPIRALRSE